MHPGPDSYSLIANDLPYGTTIHFFKIAKLISFFSIHKKKYTKESFFE